MKIFDVNLDVLHKFKTKVLDQIGAEKLLDLFERFKIEPNHLTLAGHIFGFSSIFFLFENHIYFAILLSVHLILDGLDGYYARSRKKETKLGNFLDHGGDFTRTVLILTKAYFFLPYQPLILGIIIVQFLELFIIAKNNLGKYVFPNGVFLYFFIIKQYYLGLLVHTIYLPCAFYLIFRLKKQYNQRNE